MAATVADHIIPHQGDEALFWSGELQSLCDTCHSSVKQAQEKGGYAIGCGVDGMPLDPKHPWNSA
jgi:5-methylcytosine-specific restriction protein A